jgi:hypothetical protein
MHIAFNLQFACLPEHRYVVCRTAGLEPDKENPVTHRPVAWLLLAALSLLSVVAVRKTARERLAKRVRTKPETVQTWEGEGGSLPPGPASLRTR